jgi:hypothetical protein
MNHAYDVVLAACGSRSRHGNALEVGRAAVHWQVARNAVNTLPIPSGHCASMQFLEKKLAGEALLRSRQIWPRMADEKLVMPTDLPVRK